MASYTGGSREETRIRQLEEERAVRKQEILRQKGAIVSASAGSKSVLGGRNFASHKDNVEDLLKSDTVGLVTHDDFKARREYLEKSAADEWEKRNAKQRLRDAETRKLQLRKANASKLSFAGGDEDENDDSEDSDASEGRDTKVAGGQSKGRSRSVDSDGTGMDSEIPLPGRPTSQGQSPKRRRVTKNPDADTDFLPDRDRELAEEAERERLKQEWMNEQERRKNELVNITYSYWDGSGHRRMIRCKKGTTVGRLLGIVQTQFKELRNVSADELIFVKEDLIIPHHYSFYDFIVSKARGKSGPLFNFDVVEDVRLVSDANKEKQDAHAAKVVERRWYERNRHIFPASRWTTFDPKKKVRSASAFTLGTSRNVLRKVLSNHRDLYLLPTFFAPKTPT
jgi:protein FAM50